MKVATLQDVLIEELQDLFDAEKQLVRSLPKMAKAASDPELESLFREHLEMTKGQVQRLEQCFGLLDQRPKSKPCHGMKGLVEEGQEIAGEERPEALLDAGIAGAARKVEHYEIAGYTNVISIAEQLGMNQAVELLNETLQEETETERRLTEVSKRMVHEAAGIGQEMESGDEEKSGAQQRQQKRGRAAAKSGSSGQSRSSSRTAAKKSGGGARAQSRGGQRGGSARMLTDPQEIRQWAEARGAQPACVRGTGRKKGDVGMIRLDFPGFSGEKSLQPISWEEWSRQFEENNLALMVQEQTASGEQSNFNKLVSRENAKAKRQGSPKVKKAGG
ncbi:MAG TPA: DUF892 family protein [Bryobacteraceae bacterium]|nr:DUF892 family protein [Bryobacteraceae bacterium]